MRHTQAQHAQFRTASGTFGNEAIVLSRVLKGEVLGPPPFRSHVRRGIRQHGGRLRVPLLRSRSVLYDNTSLYAVGIKRNVLRPNHIKGLGPTTPLNAVIYGGFKGVFRK